MDGLFVYTVYHPLTDMTIVCKRNEEGVLCVVQCSFGISAALCNPAVTIDTSVRTIANKIEQYLNGKETDLSDIPIVVDRFTTFQKKVIRATQNVPWGETISYQKLSQNAGYSNASRAVGNVLRNNPFCLIVPCHRIIQKNGTIGGFAGAKSGLSVHLKERLIENEKKGALPTTIQEAEIS